MEEKISFQEGSGTVEGHHSCSGNLGSSSVFLSGSAAAQSCFCAWELPSPTLLDLLVEGKWGRAGRGGEHWCLKVSDAHDVPQALLGVCGGLGVLVECLAR